MQIHRKKFSHVGKFLVNRIIPKKIPILVKSSIPNFRFSWEFEFTNHFPKQHLSWYLISTKKIPSIMKKTPQCPNWVNIGMLLGNICINSQQTTKLGKISHPVVSLLGNLKYQCIPKQQVTWLFNSYQENTKPFSKSEIGIKPSAFGQYQQGFLLYQETLLFCVLVLTLLYNLYLNTL